MHYQKRLKARVTCSMFLVTGLEEKVFSPNLIELVVFFSILFLVIFIFLLRGKKIKSTISKHSDELKARLADLAMHENNIVNQKKEIEAQIKYCDEQNNYIHTQALELEKHRHQLEKTIDSRTLELKIAKEKAEESDRLKTSFLENMSHEIRTPMNAIMGFASLLNDIDLNEATKAKYISRINKNCQSLLRLIDDIFDMSRIHAEQMTIIKERFSVNSVLLSLYKTLNEEKRELELNQIELDLIIPEKDYQLYTDQLRFSQIVTKLLSNALKYTEKGKIEFGYKPLYKSEFEKEPSYLQFHVSDTGIGIPPSKLEFIFTRFSKIETDKTKLYRGAGLGLFISKNLINMMGGQIWVQSKVIEGSTFTFTLPYFETESQKNKSSKKLMTSERKKNQTFDWRNKTILIAEDEHNNFIFLNEIIKRTGAKVIEAKNGLQAVHAIENNPEINLVLMDLLMPEMDGYNATKQIKKIRPSIPVIAQTAYTMMKEKEKSLESGCDGYISKPYNPPELLELINNFI
jgi:signal transduction histidine kinase/CheY-like chemotaxis protein